jgi:TetR/AcrR family transcriptional regulator, transcriptional repressor for nem operon
MPRDGTVTRTAIMDAAEGLILSRGFAGSSVDDIVAKAGATKGSFFYHFDSKAALARALVERFAASDQAILARHLARADALSRDPLQRMLIFVGLFREEFAQLTEPYPGCLFASCIAEAQLFDEDVHRIIADNMTVWRKTLAERFAAIMAEHPPRLPVSAESLADMLTVIFEGAFILAKTMNDPAMAAEQLGHYRSYLELLFSDAPAR